MKAKYCENCGRLNKFNRHYCTRCSFPLLSDEEYRQTKYVVGPEGIITELNGVPKFILDYGHAYFDQNGKRHDISERQYRIAVKLLKRKNHRHWRKLAFAEHAEYLKKLTAGS
jgi:RNA polymerase subunit RPABC4/transcription elongation factor Spt4